MKKNVKLIVFDMAGTTVNEDNVVYKTIQKTLESNGIVYSLEQVLEYCAGKEKRKAIRDILETDRSELATEETIERLYGEFRKELKTAYNQLDVKTFNGTQSFLKELKSEGISVVLNTGYDRNTALDLIDKLKWKQGVEFDYVITADDVERGRPFPDMINLAMKKTGIDDPSQVVKVGDSMIDIEEGRSANCTLSIGVTTGAQSREILEAAKPDYIIDSLEEILTIIQ